jgi:hypothetical protein
MFNLVQKPLYYNFCINTIISLGILERKTKIVKEGGVQGKFFLE